MKTTQFGIIAVCAVLFAACNQQPADQGVSADRGVGTSAPNSQGTASQKEIAPAEKTPETDANAAKPPDNTGRNVRDRSGAAVTPGAQSEASADIEVIQRVRQAITRDKELSTLAKNIKVVDTGNGKVVLRGPVNTDAERQQIGQLAQTVPGVTGVENQLEVKTNQ